MGEQDWRHYCSEDDLRFRAACYEAVLPDARPIHRQNNVRGFPKVTVELRNVIRVQREATARKARVQFAWIFSDPLEIEHGATP